MLAILLTRKNVGSNVIMSTKLQRLSQSNAVNNGVLSSKSTYEEYDFAEALKDFRSSDFTIDNILQVGSYDMLKPKFVSTMSNMDFADKFQDIKLTEIPESNV